MCKVLTTMLFALSLVTVACSSVANERADPMKPPPFALKKFEEAKNKNKVAKTPVVSRPQISKPAVVEEPLALTSILFSANRRVAIINDQMLVVGETIKKAKLIKIEKDYALLVRKGKKITLRLNNDLTAISKTAVETKL